MRRRGAVKVGFAVLEGVSEVRNEQVEVYIEIQFRSKSLYESDDTGVSLPGASQPGTFEHCAGQRSSNNPQPPGEPLRMGGEPQAQRPGEGQDPLSHGHPGKHVVDQVRSSLGHAPGPTRGTESS